VTEAPFAAIVRRHGPAVFRYASGMLGRRASNANDAVQSVWIKTWRHLASYRGEAQLRTLPFRITANEVHHRARQTPPGQTRPRRQDGTVAMKPQNPPPVDTRRSLAVAGAVP